MTWQTEFRKIWRKKFTRLFTDNVIPGSHANDLTLDKEDCEILMNFIEGTIKDLLDQKAREIGRLKKKGDVALAWGELTKEEWEFNKALDQAISILKE